MLYRNGENLKEELVNFLSNKKNITIFSPYVKATTLKKLLDSPGLKCEQIIVRWEPKDLAIGSSDLEVYDLCKEYSIALYMNSRIHLKLFTNNFQDTFLGSANISERAISDTNSKYNYEICAHTPLIDRADRLYLNKVINESILVTDEIYTAIKEQIPEISPDINKKTFVFPDITNEKSDFLISKLPMIDSPELLWKLFSGEKEPDSLEQENCFCHDVILYKVKATNKSAFYEDLANCFFDLPFIKSFLEEVKNAKRTTRNGDVREGLQFGSVKIWFSNNTTSVPSPRPFELTTNVQILYTWIEILSDGKYSITTPGARSQVIKKVV
ncbi:MAG: hypothetical protein GXO85_12445 [Chlorobi bacterium]|nr:hypothetical protein [Chlorobiota bacterium]